MPTVWAPCPGNRKAVRLTASTLWLARKADGLLVQTRELGILFHIDHGSSHVIATDRTNDMGWQWCAAFCTIRQLTRFFSIMRTSFSRSRIGVFSFGNRHDGLSFLGVQGLLDFLTKRTSHPKTRAAGCQPQGRLVSGRQPPESRLFFVEESVLIFFRRGGWGGQLEMLPGEISCHAATRRAN